MSIEEQQEDSDEAFEQDSSRLGSVKYFLISTTLLELENS